MSATALDARCRAKGCSGRVEVIVTPTGRTREVCGSCARRRAWEKAGCPEVEGRECLVCGGRTEPLDREDAPGQPRGRSRTRCDACRAVKRRVHTRRQRERKPETVRARDRRRKAARMRALRELRAHAAPPKAGAA